MPSDAADPLVTEAHVPVIETSTRTVNMIRFANNNSLAAKVSLRNDIGTIWQKLDIGASETADTIGLNNRVSEHFLQRA